MPSNSYTNFHNLLMKDVIKLCKTHEQLNQTGKGKRGLGHITRSGVFMLCAAWEIYNEDVVRESFNIIINIIDNADSLTHGVRAEIVNNFLAAKDKSKIFNLTGERWKDLSKSLCNKHLDCFNTPNYKKLKKIYKQYLGIEDIADSWSLGGQYIDSFVKARGAIAHKGSSSNYIKIALLKKYIQNVSKTVEENDKYLLKHLKTEYLNGGSPWNNTYKKNIKL